MILSLDESGGLRLGNPPELLPGFVTSASIGGELVFDSSALDGVSSQKYKLKGWKDSDVIISLTLTSSKNKTRDEYLQEIVSKFKASDSDGAPIVYTIDFPQARAWKITRVFFSNLRTKQNGGKQEYQVDLSFTEYIPEVATIQKKKQEQIQNSNRYEIPTFPDAYTPVEEIKIEKIQLSIGGGL